jgi:pimeloyl-ACP methyl ester carboxylesterase
MPVASLLHHGQEVNLSFEDAGQGEPVLLVHGFASTKEVNWINTGWFKALAAAGFRAIAFDNRGHGQSSKFHDPALYRLDLMAADAIALLDHLGVKRCSLIGYSMGARICSRLAIDHGERFGRVVLSGNGWGMIEGTGDWTPVEQALLTASLSDVSDPRGRAFRAFADQTGSDRLALAACVSGVRQTFSEDEMRCIGNETLIAIGDRDDIAGSGEKLAALLPNATFVSIPGRDHMKAVGDKLHVASAIAFLKGGRDALAAGIVQPA